MGLQQSFVTYKGNRYPHYYLCNYLPVSAGPDRFSHSLLKFKQGRQPDLSAWIDCALEILAGSPTSLTAAPVSPTAGPEIPEIPVIRPGTILMRSLHHQERVAEEITSLDRLGEALATYFQSIYMPQLLCKTQNVREMKGLSQTERERELKDRYFLDINKVIPGNEAVNPDNHRSSKNSTSNNNGILERSPDFLIIDDILTTGTTVKMIIGVLKTHYPQSRIQVFTLAKADYDAKLNKSTLLKGQHYRLEEGIDWTVAEEDFPYYSYRDLTAWIKER